MEILQKEKIWYVGDWVYVNSHLYNINTHQLIALKDEQILRLNKQFIETQEFQALANSQSPIIKRARANQILALELTDRCNYACEYCFEGKSSMNTGILDFTLACKAIDSIPQGSELRFFGGEPLLQFDLIKKIVNKYPKNTYSIVTNGSLITDEIASFFSDYKFSVGLSFDGKFWQKKNRCRSNGDSMKDFRRAVNLLDRYKVCFGISSVLTKESIPYLYDLHLEIFDDYPTHGWAYLIAYSKEMTMDDLGIFKDNLFAIIQDFPAQHLLKINDLKKWSMKISGEWPIDGFCGAGSYYKALTCSGQYRFCTFFLREESCYGPTIGSIKMNCKKCKIWNYCFGGCKALNLYGSGEAYKSHPFSCKKNHIYFEAGLKTAIKIKNELHS